MKPHATPHRAHSNPHRAHAHANPRRDGASITARLDRLADAIDATLDDIPVTDVPGTWRVDRAKALADAKRFLRAVDFRRPNIFIWVPGTDNEKLHPALEPEVNRRFDLRRTSVHTLRYEASWRMDVSAPTGLRTLRLVLAAIGAQRGGHKVLLAAESQGAWIVGEAISDPRLSGVVTRASLLGHPINARHHFHDMRDPRVIELSNDWDKVTMPTWGPIKTAMDATIALHRFEAKHLPTILAASIQNPIHTALTAIEMLRERVPDSIKQVIPDPHNYSNRMPEAAAWLAGGAV